MHESLTTINFSNNNIPKIIGNLESNKAHGHDIKICDGSICKPLKLIFQSCLESGKFSSELKKENVVPIHIKGDKEISKDYLLLEKSLIECLRNMMSDNQSGFKQVI